MISLVNSEPLSDCSIFGIPKVEKRSQRDAATSAAVDVLSALRMMKPVNTSMITRSVVQPLAVTGRCTDVSTCRWSQGPLAVMKLAGWKPALTMVYLVQGSHSDNT